MNGGIYRAGGGRPRQKGGPRLVREVGEHGRRPRVGRTVSVPRRRGGRQSGRETCPSVCTDDHGKEGQAGLPKVGHCGTFLIVLKFLCLR